MDPKSIFASKTFWANIVALVATLAGVWGIAIPTDQQATVVAGVMALVNIGLRCVTKGPVNLTGSAAWLLPLCAALALSACSGDPTTDAAKAHAYVVAYQPLVDDGLCRAQALANSAGAVAQAAGDAEAIKNAQLASVAAGAGCFALHPVVVPAVAP